MNLFTIVLCLGQFVCLYGFMKTKPKSPPRTKHEPHLFGTLEIIVSREAFLASVRKQMMFEIVDANPLVKNINHAITFYPSDWITYFLILSSILVIKSREKSERLEKVPTFQRKRRNFEKCIILFAVIFMKNVENAI